MPLEFLDTDIQAAAEKPFCLCPDRGISFSSKSRQFAFHMLRINIATYTLGFSRRSIKASS